MVSSVIFRERHPSVSPTLSYSHRELQDLMANSFAGGSVICSCLSHMVLLGSLIREFEEQGQDYWQQWPDQPKIKKEQPETNSVTVS